MSLHISGAPSRPLNTFKALLWTFPVCPCHFPTGEPRTGPRTPDVFYQCLVKGKNHSLVMLFLMQPRCCWPPLPQGHIAGSWSTCCPLGPSGPFLQSCFPFYLPPDCAVYEVLPFQLQDFAFPFVKFHDIPVSPFLQPVWGSSEVQTCPPVNWQCSLIWYNPWILWGYISSNL